MATTTAPQLTDELPDDATRQEVAEAIVWHNKAIKRVPAISGLIAHPTRYDFLHMRLNKLLDAYEAAPAD